MYTRIYVYPVVYTTAVRLFKIMKIAIELNPSEISFPRFFFLRLLLIRLLSLNYGRLALETSRGTARARFNNMILSYDVYTPTTAANVSDARITMIIL